MLDPLTSLLVTAFLVTLGLSLFWPERGLLSRWQHARRMTDRVLTEDTLKHIHNCAMAGDRPTIQSIAGALQINPAKDQWIIFFRVEIRVYLLNRFRRPSSASPPTD